MQEILNGLILMGIPLVVAIPLIIAAFRSWGMSERLTGPVAAILGIAGVAVIEALKAYPVIEPYVAIIFLGFLVGLASNGAFSQWAMFRRKMSGDPDPGTDNQDPK